MSKPVSGNARKTSGHANGAAALATPIHSTTEVKPDAERIRRRAYELYLERARTGRPGNEVADWMQAERDLRAAS